MLVVIYTSWLHCLTSCTHGSRCSRRWWWWWFEILPCLYPQFSPKSRPWMTYIPATTISSFHTSRIKSKLFKALFQVFFLLLLEPPLQLSKVQFNRCYFCCYQSTMGKSPPPTSWMVAAVVIFKDVLVGWWGWQILITGSLLLFSFFSS